LEKAGAKKMQIQNTPKGQYTALHIQELYTQCEAYNRDWVAQLTIYSVAMQLKHTVKISASGGLSTAHIPLKYEASHVGCVMIWLASVIVFRGGWFIQNGGYRRCDEKAGLTTAAIRAAAQMKA
jgi:hypothetical protein